MAASETPRRKEPPGALWRRGAAAFLLWPAPAWAAFAPFGYLDLFGSQSFFQGNSSNFGGNAAFSFVPAWSITDRDILVPRVHVNYQGIRSAVQVIDEGSLFQEQITMAGGLKYIRKTSPDTKLKAEFSGRSAWMNEVKNEDWGDGLYDHQEIGVSGEWEHGARGSAVHRAGLSVFNLRYPNYKSLSSSVGLELQGERLLDTNNIMGYYAGDYPRGRNLFKFRASLEGNSFTDQKRVQEQGDFSSDNRFDAVTTLRAGYTRFVDEKPWRWFSSQGTLRPVPGLETYLRLKRSDQNHYDADQLKFVDGFYDYTTVGIVPSFATRITPGDWTVRLSYDASYRRYAQRPIQDSLTGEYQGDKLWQVVQALNLNISQPLAWVMPGISWQAEFGVNDSQSNMTFERFYRYNYTSINYLVGLRYDF